MLLDEIIKEMGYAFRDLTYHSSGRYSCRLGESWLKGIKGTREFWGDTPLEAVLNAKNRLDELDNDLGLII